MQTYRHFRESSLCAGGHHESAARFPSLSSPTVRGVGQRLTHLSRRRGRNEGCWFFCPSMTIHSQDCRPNSEEKARAAIYKSQSRTREPYGASELHGRAWNTARRGQPNWPISSLQLIGSTPASRIGALRVKEIALASPGIHSAHIALPW